MKKILSLAFALLILASPVFAQGTPISGLNNGGLIQNTDQIPVTRAGANFRVHEGPMAGLAIGTGLASDGTNLNVSLDSITSASGAATGAVVRLSSGAYGLAASACSLFSDPTTCAKLLGFADPRQFGAFCGSNFNVNNATQDDAPGIQAALNTGVPVMIPYPGCKMASQVQAQADGATLFSTGSGAAYNSNNPTSPYIYLPNNITTGTTNNCAFDWNGYDNVTLRHIVFRANFNEEGTVAVCNSVGIRSPRSAAFLNIDGLSILNAGAGIGSAMESFSTNPSTHCGPVGTLGNPVYQVHGHGLNIIGTCNAIFANISDWHMTDTYISSTNGVCLGLPSSSGAAADIDGIRCEYNNQILNGGGTFYADGAGIILNGFGAVHLSNATCDHINGSCVQLPAGAKHIALNNITSIDSGGDYSGVGTITNQCAYTMLGVTDVAATNMSAFKNQVNVPYTLCMQGSNDSVTWQGTDGQAGGFGGFSTAYFNIATNPTNSRLSVPGLGEYLFGTPVALGTMTPNAGSAIDASATTGSIALPVGTTGQRPASPIVGQIRYNSTSNGLEAYVGSSPAWSSVATGASGITALTGVVTASGSGSVVTSFGSFTSSVLATAITDETGTGLAVFNGSPTFTGTVAGAAATWSGVSTALNFAATGTGANVLPIGTTGQEPSGVEGMLRDNTTLHMLETFVNGGWQQVVSGVNGLVNLASQVTGILPVANGGTGTTYATNSAIFAFVGDSRIAQMFNDGVYNIAIQPSAHVKTNHWFNVANALLGQRMRIVYAGGISGDTCPQWNVNVPTALATNAAWLVPHGLVNDIANSGMTGSNTQAQILASSQTIWSCEQTVAASALAVGKKVILIGEPGAQNFTPTQITQEIQINELMREYAAVTPGVYFFDLPSYLWVPVPTSNPTTSIAFCAGCTVDGTHLNTLGHFTVGQGFAAFISPLLPANPTQVVSANEIPTQGNVQQLVNQLFTTTTGGTLATGFTGSMPANYFMQLNGTPTGNVTTVADPSGFGNDLVVTINFNTSTDYVRIGQGTTFGDYTVPGDILEGGAEFIVDPSSNALGGVTAQILQFPTQSNNQMDMFPYNNAPYPSVAIDFVEKTPPLQIITSTTAITYYDIIYASGAGTVKVTIKRPWLRRKFAA